MRVSSSASSAVFEQNEYDTSDTSSSECFVGNKQKKGSKNEGFTDSVVKELLANQKAMLQRIGELEKEIIEQRRAGQLAQNELAMVNERLVDIQLDVREKLFDMNHEIDKDKKTITNMQSVLSALEKGGKENGKDKGESIAVCSSDDSIVTVALLPIENCWNKEKCHSDLAIIGSKNLIVHCKKRTGWRTVFATFSAFAGGSKSFYFEVKVVNMGTNHAPIFGLAEKERAPLAEVVDRPLTYAWEGDGFLWTEGVMSCEKAKFGRGDVVGFGFDMDLEQFIFTKNGKRLSFSPFVDLCLDYEVSLFPFVSLFNSGDLVEANFGPNFLYTIE